MKTLNRAAALITLGIAATLPASAQPGPVPVNPKLVEFQKQYTSPRLVEVSPGIFAAMAYDYSNFFFIEGKTGIIVVDTGWFQKPFEQAFADLRKYSDKPVVAVIYTHAHQDHTGGGRFAVSQGRGDVPVYAPSGFDNLYTATEGPTQAITQKRGFQQMGFGLPGIGIPLIGSGVGPAVQPGERAVAPPTKLVEKTEALTIDGVRIELIRTEVDLPEALMVWLPDQQILMPGDIVGGVFPFVKTPRYEPQRNPADMVRAIDLSLGFKPRMVLPGHGKELLTKADIDDVLIANRDAIQYLTDQVDRGLMNGLSAEEIVHIVQLPPQLAAHPQLQPYYHRREWIVRAMVNDRLGFFDNYLQLFRHDGVEEARRFVALGGGDVQMLATARTALTDGDPRWALRLVDLLRLAGHDGPQVMQVYADALQKLAETTDNMNERHYALSEKAGVEGRINWPEVLAPRLLPPARQLSNAVLIGEMGARLKAELASGQMLTIGVAVAGDDARYALHLRNQVLRLETGGDPAATSLAVPREALVLMRARQITWAGLLSRPDVSIRGDRGLVDRFVALME
jgi:alkyl sulfatase BDS1-like metallo-beta-lactamase superfamily hydrolase